MIVMDFSWAVALYVVGWLGVVLIPWLFYNYKETRPVKEAPDDIRQCPFCTGVFFVYADQDICTCPACGSYIQSRKGEADDQKT